MKHHPVVMTETETMLAAIGGRSLARYGDGELRIADGRSAISQHANGDLRNEMIKMLRGPSSALVCIPRQMAGGNKQENWRKYAQDRFVKLYGEQPYGSSFITRPDNAPNIATKEFYAMVVSLWSGKHVTLVVGTDHGSLEPRHMTEALSVKVVYGPRRDAFGSIDSLMEQVGSPSGPVILCLGACATVMAERLSRKGVHALDLGHIGRFAPRFIG